MAEEMADDLHHATSSDVSAYTVDGILLSSSDRQVFAGSNTDDLEQALAARPLTP